MNERKFFELNDGFKNIPSETVMEFLWSNPKISVETVAAAVPSDNGKRTPEELEEFWSEVFDLAFESDNARVKLLVVDKTVRFFRFGQKNIEEPSRRAMEFQRAFKKSTPSWVRASVCFDNKAGVKQALKLSRNERMNEFLRDNFDSIMIRSDLPKNKRTTPGTFGYLAHHFLTYLSTGAFNNRGFNEKGPRLFVVPPTELPFMRMLGDALSEKVFRQTFRGQILVALIESFDWEKPPYRG